MPNQMSLNKRLEEIWDITQKINGIQSEIQKEQSQITAGQRYRTKLEKELKELEAQEHTKDDKEKLRALD